MSPKPRVLVVEDDDQLGSMMVRLLIRQGFDAELATRCDQAKDLIDRASTTGQPYTAIVATVCVRDGFTATVCVHVEAQIRIGKLRFVALSADWSSDRNATSRTYFRQIGAPMLDKPYELQALLKAIRGE